jgi:type II secretion system protein G
MKRLSKKGFTLVELLVVMAIIGILAAVIMGGFRSSQRRSRDAKRKSDLRQIGQALELFYADFDRYPTASNGQIEACAYTEASDTGVACAWGSGKMEESASGRIYFRELPNDSRNGQDYYYKTLNSNQSYQLYARLENPEDQHCIDGCCASDTSSGCALPTLPAGVECGAGVVCDFSVTSTDVTPKDTD